MSQEVQRAYAEIDEHLRNAREEIKRAQEIADKYGIIIKFNLEYSTIQYRNVPPPVEEWDSSMQCFEYDEWEPSRGED